MPNKITLPISTNSVPVGFCFSGFNSPSWNELVGLLYTEVEVGNGTIYISDTTPPPAYQGVPWFKAPAQGLTPTDDPTFLRLYHFSGGDWIARFDPWYCSGKNGLMLFDGTEADVKMIGRPAAEVADAAITDRTGAFWEIDTNYAGRFPIGVGQIPNGDPDHIRTLTVGNTGGEAEHKLTQAELPAHQHGMPSWLGDNDDDENPRAAASRADNKVAWNEYTKPIGGGEYHENLPPYRALYFLKRTARQYYVG